MLLYDRLMDAGLRFLRRYWDRRDDPEIVRHGKAFCLLADSVVFQLDDVTPLFGDWEREKDHPVPKNCPVPLAWAEWHHREEGNGDWTDWQIGVSVRSHARQEIVRLFGESPSSRGGRSLDEFLDGGDLYYACQMFKLVGDSSGMGTIPRHSVHVDPGLFVWRMRSDGSACSCFKFVPGFLIDPRGMSRSEVERQMRDASIFGLSLLASEYPDDVHDQVAYPWVPFMAFALLHCKNVTAEDHVPDERTQRRARKGGCYPRCIYKTLRVEVPAHAQRRGTYDEADGDDGPKVRFHLCRGHFKNLQHERFKAKGWHWWPAHWRGSTDLGSIAKDYQLSSKKDSSHA